MNPSNARNMRSTHTSSETGSEHSNPSSAAVACYTDAWGGRGSLLGVLGATLGILLCLLLVGCNGSRSTLSRVSLAPPDATATAAARATATAGTIPLIALPISESAPGCGTTAADWIVQSAEGVACLNNPQRMHLAGEPYASSFCCENQVELPFGTAGRLSSTFRVTVEVSGLLGQVRSGDDLIARLFVRLEPDKDLFGPSPFFITGFDVGGDGSAVYTLGLSGRNASGAFDTAMLMRPITVALTVDAYTASVALNGVTYLQRPLATPVTVAAIALQMVGPSGSSVEFSNLKVELVTGGAPALS